MLNLVGNAPSSGSTLLADLLDASDYTACGPELGAFANSHIYDIGNSKKEMAERSGTATLYTTGVGVYEKGLPGYGLSKDILRAMAEQSESFEDFSLAFVERYISLRNKHQEAQVFEKTPQNINCITQFLKSTTEGSFIFLIRNPLYVHRSLMKRGYSTLQAIGTWMIAAAKYLNNCNNARVTYLRYEDLVEDPFGLSADIIGRITQRDINSQVLKDGYEKNRYRHLFEGRINTWNASNVGQVSNSNFGEIDLKDMQRIAAMLDWRINPKYASRFGLADISFREALLHFGYQHVEYELDKSPRVFSGVGYSDAMFFLRRWGADIKRKEAGIRDVFTYLSPFETNKKCA